MPRYANLQERLLANSVPVHTGFKLNGEPSECWEWIGNRDEKGYGRINVRIAGKHRKLRAHRVAHEEFKGVVLDDEDTLEHHCRFTSCIAPDHTEVVTRVQNSKLRWEAWRNYRDEAAGQTRIDVATA